MAYQIERRPNMASITPGAVVAYECVGPKTLGMYADGTYYEEVVRWWVFRDRRAEGKDMKFVNGIKAKEGESPYGWVRTFDWQVDPGDYLVIAEIRKRGSSADPEVVVLAQHLMSEAEVKGELAKLITKAHGAPLANPDEADSLIGEELLALDAIVKNGPALSPAQQQEHKKSVDRWTECRKKLSERLASTNGRRRIPIIAVHIDFATQQRRQLNFFLADLTDKESKKGQWGTSDHTTHVWRLVDWTNPESRAESSEADGTGQTAEAAVVDALGDWDWWRSRYPKGRISFEVPTRACGTFIKREFETDGATTWDKIVGALSVTAMAAGMVIIGVATLGTAIPAEIAAATAATALIVSTASGVGAEVISISVRRAEGIHDTKADVISVLGVVASLFQLRWIKGATVSMPGKPGLFRFLGHVAEGSVNVAQGVLILDDQFDTVQRELERLRKDPNLLPEERARQISVLFARLAATGALTFIALRADAEQLASLAKKRGVPTAKSRRSLDDFADTEKHIDLNEPKPTEGDVSNGTAKTTADTREPPPKSQRPPVQNALMTAPAGTRTREHNAFKKLSKDRLIFVRDSNPARLQSYPFPVASKPEKCKFKTLKEGPYEGLAAAGPDDPVVKEILAAEGWDFHRDHAKLVKYIEGKGFSVGTEAEQYIVRNKRTGEAFVGDIDVHGIYALDGGRRVELTPAERALFNEESGAVVVMHGAHDDWEDRLSRVIDGKANVNYGPQPPVTAYVNGEAKELHTWREMKEFASQYGINLEAEYAGIDWAYWREMRTKAKKGIE